MPPKPKIDYESWVALDSERLLTERELKRMSLAWRIWEIALSHINNWNHAAFHKDELVKLVCGQVNRSNTQAVYRGMRNLAEMGRIAPAGDKGSTLFCILVNEVIGKRRAGKGNYTFLCSEITHMDMRQEPYVRYLDDDFDSEFYESVRVSGGSTYNPYE